jgi:F0F1-type ATP synthase assembly protein I
MVQQRKSGPGTAAEASRYLGVGLTWALSTALFLYLGSVADRRLGTEPWLTLIGAFVGAVAGFWYMYRQLVIDPERKRAAERRAQQDAAVGEERKRER